MLRTTGVAAAVIVVALDMAKGAGAVLVAQRRRAEHAAPAAAGVAAVVGHIYPVWLRFRGGKGVATACGVFAVLAPAAIGAGVGALRRRRLDDAVRLARLGRRTVALPPLA